MRSMRAIVKTVSLTPFNNGAPTDIEIADGLSNGNLVFNSMDLFTNLRGRTRLAMDVNIRFLWVRRLVNTLRTRQSLLNCDSPLPVESKHFLLPFFRNRCFEVFLNYVPYKAQINSEKQALFY